MNARTLGGICLKVAPGEPTDPMRAEVFELTWWELAPVPADAPTIYTVRMHGERMWAFCMRKLGTEARELVGCAQHDPRLLRTITGRDEYAFQFADRFALN